MSVPVNVNIVPEDHPIRSHLHMTADYITIHETANVNEGAGDEMHGLYILSGNAVKREVLWHLTGDDDSITQHIPLDEVGWHAGDGFNGLGNRTSIGFELCVNADGDFDKTLRNAAWYIAHYIIKPGNVRKPFPECMVQHNKWSGKDCPHFIRATPGLWEKFLGYIKAELIPPLRVTHNGEVVECEPTNVDGSTRVKLRPLIESLMGRVVEPLEWDGATQTANIVSRPERWWSRFIR